MRIMNDICAKYVSDDDLYVKKLMYNYIECSRKETLKQSCIKARSTCDAGITNT